MGTLKVTLTVQQVSVQTNKLGGGREMGEVGVQSTFEQCLQELFCILTLRFIPNIIKKILSTYGLQLTILHNSEYVHVSIPKKTQCQMLSSPARTC